MDRWIDLPCRRVDLVGSWAGRRTGWLAVVVRRRWLDKGRGEHELFLFAWRILSHISHLRLSACLSAYPSMPLSRQAYILR